MSNLVTLGFFMILYGKKTMRFFVIFHLGWASISQSRRITETSCWAEYIVTNSTVDRDVCRCWLNIANGWKKSKNRCPIWWHLVFHDFVREKDNAIFCDFPSRMSLDFAKSSDYRDFLLSRVHSDQFNSWQGCLQMLTQHCKQLKKVKK